MSEWSAFWTTTGGAPTGHQQVSYTQVQWTIALQIIASVHDYQGIAPAYYSAYSGSVPGANTVRIAAGGALVDGKVHIGIGSTDINIPSAVGGGNTRIDRIVLRCNWAGYIVSIYRIPGVNAASPTEPAYEQTSGTLWDLLLYNALVNTAGAVTLVDTRITGRIGPSGIIDQAILHSKLADEAVETHNIKDANVTLAKMAADSIDSAQYVDGSIDQEHLSNGASKVSNRQGSSATNWNSIGSTNYVPASARILCGAVNVPGGGTVDVTFPITFGGIPVVFVTAETANNVMTAYPLSTSQVRISCYSGGSPSSGNCFWLAIGPA
jgi:hypothetical protein